MRCEYQELTRLTFKCEYQELTRLMTRLRLRLWVSVQTNTVSTASQTIQLENLAQASAGFYRLIAIP